MAKSPIRKKASSKKASSSLSRKSRKKRFFGFLIFIAAILLLWGFGYSLKKENPLIIYEESFTKVQLSLENLYKLDKAVYELWQITRNQEISLGKFNFDDKGQIIDMYGQIIEGGEFDLASIDDEEIQAFEITIEPNPDDDLNPSTIELVSGDLKEKKAKLDFILDLNNTKGSYILASPTDGNTNRREEAGIWFFYESDKTQIASLDLPVLPEGWKYEAWIEYENNIISIGKFSDPAVADESAVFCGSKTAPTFPGEDFLRKPDQNYPLDLPFKLNNGTTRVFITLEPDLDGQDPTGDSAFSIQFLNATITEEAEVHKSFDLILDLNNIPEVQIKLVS